MVPGPVVLQMVPGAQLEGTSVPWSHRTYTDALSQYIAPSIQLGVAFSQLVFISPLRVTWTLALLDEYC